ncbi:hypothetical protein INR49_010884 [Caranx melampygus]|nr:hypothetical protein INR49_010884 [Caranx melampygus]
MESGCLGVWVRCESATSCQHCRGILEHDPLFLLTGLVHRCQSVYVGVVDVSSLPEQRCHLLPVSGGAGGHKHSSLGEPDFRPPRSGTARGFPGLRSRPIRLRAQPSLQLILPTLFRSFGPGMIQLMVRAVAEWMVWIEPPPGCAPWWRHSGDRLWRQPMCSQRHQMAELKLTERPHVENICPALS